MRGALQALTAMKGPLIAQRELFKTRDALKGTFRTRDALMVPFRTLSRNVGI